MKGAVATLQDESGAAPKNQSTPQGQVPPAEEEIRMALVVNDGLKMGKGKIGKCSALAGRLAGAVSAKSKY